MSDVGIVGGAMFLGALAALLGADLLAALRLRRWRQRFDPSLEAELGVPLPWALRRLAQWREGRR